MTRTLDYDHVQRPVPSIWLYRIALACGLLPMAVGTLVFLGYLVSRDMSFAVLGFFTIFAGLAATFVAAVCLAVYYAQMKRAGEADRVVARRNLWRAAAVVIANFPLAGLYAGVGLFMLNRQSERVNVVIANQDATPTLVQLDTGGDTQVVGPIAAGGTGSATIEFGGKGLSATLTRSGQPTTRQTILDHMDEDTVGFGMPLNLVIKNGQINER
jgi:hypothetical protein